MLAQLLSEPIIAAIEEAAAAAISHRTRSLPLHAPRPDQVCLLAQHHCRLPQPYVGSTTGMGTTLALLGAGVVAGLIWYFSGLFTLDYLTDTFLPFAALIAGSPWWQVWLIPSGISAMELFLWPRRERRLGIFIIRLILWSVMLAFDVLTTYRGMLPILRQAGAGILRSRLTNAGGSTTAPVW